MKDKVNRAQAHQNEGGLTPLYHFIVGMATAQFRFEMPNWHLKNFRPDFTNNRI
jgi:hypothetical protein